MSCKCELTGVNAQFGNKVSHSQRKTRRRFNPNVRIASYKSEITGQKYRLRIIAKTIRTIEKVGGFDAFMLKISNDELLSARAKIIRKTIKKKHIEAVA